MNRRRIALVALVVAIGAAVRRRVRTAAGPETPASPPTQSPDPIADGRSDVARAAADVSTTGPVDGVTLGADVSLGEPEIEVPGPSGTKHVTDAAVDEVTLGEPQIESEQSERPTSESEPAEELGTEPSPSAAPADPPAAVVPDDTPPPIVLPTMPRAGTNDSADTGSQSTAVRVVRPGASLAMGVGSGDLGSPGIPMHGSARPVLPEMTTAMSTAANPPGPVPAASDQTGGHEPPPSDSIGEPSAGRPVWYRRRGWRIVGSVVTTVVILAVIAASVVRLPYYSLRPGSVYNTIERVEAPGDLVSIPNGEISFVTVSQTANITPWQWLDGQLDGNVRIRHEDDVRGDQTADELREADVRRMQVSKDAAVVVALRKLGYELVVTPIGIEVAQVFPCTAADGTLGTGDLIIGVDGADVRDGEQLVAALAEIGVGEDVELLVERIDPSNPTQSIRTEPVILTLGSADADCLPDDIRAEEPRPFIGIGTLTIVDEDFPIEIDVETGSVGGPSAGLAFTLAIIDVLSEGELTNGLTIVATGTIDRDGNVGPVGGIHQKTVAAERSGADVFLVPACCDNFVSRSTGEPLDMPSNYEEALAYADDMTVIGVNTLDEALAAIGELGGDVDDFITATG